ncbi:hypothetical protein EJB05_49094 [Eragrostis curvula]|uniref:Uncharacterized protein n=1 Tax=Eragrostis curvula TaxID=38414 RepID=A0A5J9T3D1_9POAL|nr:hypothetical protein EJB05_49094 [Eragrostis curvula]
MAVAQGLVSSPPAEAAATRGRLTLAVTDAVDCLLCASFWLGFAAWPAWGFGHLAGVGDWPVVHVAGVVTICALILQSVCTVTMCLLIEKEKAPRRMEDREATVFICSLSAVTTFFVLFMVGFMVNSFSHKGSLGERIGLAIMGLGLFSISTFMCLIVIPTMALMSWRMRRSGWRRGSKFEEKPSGGGSVIQMGKDPQALTIC